MGENGAASTGVDKDKVSRHNRSALMFARCASDNFPDVHDLSFEVFSVRPSRTAASAAIEYSCQPTPQRKIWSKTDLYLSFSPIENWG